MPRRVWTFTELQNERATSAVQTYPWVPCPGLFVYLYPSGEKSWVIRWRIGKVGSPKKRTIGGFYEHCWSLRAVLARAKIMKDLMDQGMDPGAPPPAPVVRPTAFTLNDAWSDYELRWLPKKASSYADEQKRYWKRDIQEALGPMPLEELMEHGFLVKWLDNFEDTPVKQDHIQAILSKLFTFTMTRRKLPYHPLMRMKEKNGAKARDRRLEGDEFKRFGKAWAACRYEHREAILMLLLTGARVSGLIELKPAFLRGDHIKFSDEVPGDGTKGTRVIVLSRAAQAMVPKLKLGEMTHRTFRVCLDKICSDAGIEDFTPHDCRRTYESFAGDIGIDQSTINVLISHSRGPITEAYSRRSLDSMLKTQEEITEAMLGILGLHPRSAARNIIPPVPVPAGLAGVPFRIPGQFGGGAGPALPAPGGPQPTEPDRLNESGVGIPPIISEELLTPPTKRPRSPLVPRIRTEPFKKDK